MAEKLRTDKRPQLAQVNQVRAQELCFADEGLRKMFKAAIAGHEDDFYELRTPQKVPEKTPGIHANNGEEEKHDFNENANHMLVMATKIAVAMMFITFIVIATAEMLTNRDMLLAMAQRTHNMQENSQSSEESLSSTSLWRPTENGKSCFNKFENINNGQYPDSYHDSQYPDSYHDSQDNNNLKASQHNATDPYTHSNVVTEYKKDRSWVTSAVDGTIKMFSQVTTGANTLWAAGCSLAFLARLGIVAAGGIGLTLVTCFWTGAILAVVNWASYVVSSHNDNGGFNFDNK